MAPMESTQSIYLRHPLRRYVFLHIWEIEAQIRATIPVDQLSLWCNNTLLRVRVRTSIIDSNFAMASIRDLLYAMERLQKVIYTTDTVRDSTWIINKERQSKCAIYISVRCAVVVATDPLTVNEVAT